MLLFSLKNTWKQILPVVGGSWVAEPKLFLRHNNKRLRYTDCWDAQLYLTVCLHIHSSIQYERLQVDVGLWCDGPSFSCLADHSQPFVETPLVVELS